VIYLALGAGVQSSAMLVMSALGLRGCPRADVTIFADVGDEPAWVYEHLAILEAWAARNDLEICRVSAGHLSADVAARHNGGRTRCAAVPAYTVGKDGRSAILRRQCTREYKIDPIEKEVRHRLGLVPRQRAPRGSATALIGISTDEASRMKPSRSPWCRNQYPLVEAGMRRADCLALLREHGLPEPRKSSCVFCPYHSDHFWKRLKLDYPDEFSRAVAFDEEIRDMSASGLRHPAYLHRSLIALSDVDFSESQLDLFDEECAGVCGV